MILSMRRENNKNKRSQKFGHLTGPLHIGRNGTGFVLDANDSAVWILPQNLQTAMADDVVEVELTSKDEGRIVNIVERAARSIVGTVKSLSMFNRVEPLSSSFRQEFLVPDAKGAKVGDRVVMRFVRWTSRNTAPEGEITEIIGPIDNPSLDTLAIMKQYDLPVRFPAKVIAVAEQIEQGASDDEKRMDLRKKFIFTCDPESARDYDDALSLETDRKGNRVLGVHIADVSHYVKENSPLDREAAKRTTSVYLVDKVVPMLPEQLSNGVCSLMPNEDRLAFSVFLTYDKDGNCVARKFAKSIIRSKARFTYEQVMAIIQGKKARNAKVVMAISELAAQLRAKRFADGALDMDIPERRVVLDSQGRMTGSELVPYDESHQMIEECMVAANEAVAKELWTRGIKILARLHEAPDPERIEELSINLARLGLRCGNLNNQAVLGKFLKRIKGTPLEGVISVMVLKSMKRAVYSSKEIGHFGLAKKYYAHFTSPIRRYPDLVLHRQLAAYLTGKGGKLPPTYLAKTAQACSEAEQAADEAERALAEIKCYRFLEANAPSGKSYDAIIGKCTRYGIFVDLVDYQVGGMVHISQLSQDFVRFDEATESLRTDKGVRWRVGDKLQVRVKSIEFARRQIDFEIVQTKKLKGKRK